MYIYTYIHIFCGNMVLIIPVEVAPILFLVKLVSLDTIKNRKYCV